jgi:tetratricopeptide (TPR) repeat protein
VAGYRIERLLGRGGFGSVFQARAATADRRPSVALKVAGFGALASERLCREAVALRMVGPPHVPAVYEVGALPDGRAYVAMELIVLPLLSERLAALRDGMTLDELQAAGSALLQATQAVHARGLVHRDLKPENVFMSPGRDGRCVARLFDFGLVESLAGPDALAHGALEPTATGEMGGTPEYMAPEQCEMDAPIDCRIDVYAVGVMLYEMIAGRTPFWGSAVDVHQAHLHRRPPRPSDLVPVPAAIEDVVLRCLAKDPERRYPSVQELAGDLLAAVAHARAHAGQTVAAPAPRAADRKRASHPRRSMAVLALQGVSDIGCLKGALATMAGELAHVGRSSVVAVFGQKGSENPIRRAMRAAESLIGRGLATRVLVDVATVAVQRRMDGSERYVSNAFGKVQRLVTEHDAGGIYVTPAVAPSSEAARQEPLPGRAVIRVVTAGDGGVDPVAVMHEAQAPLVGRDELLAELKTSASVAISQGKPVIATVIAEPGCGKTHFASVLAPTLRQTLDGVEIVELRAREPMDGDPDTSLRALLRRCLDLPLAMPKDRGQALLTEKLGGELWPAAALALGWLAPDAPSLRAPGAAPGVLRTMVVRSAGEALRRLAAERPLILIVDDAHYADQATADAIEYATLAEAGARLWICVLASAAFEAGRPSWGERAAARLRVRLGPLEAAPAIELCRQLLLPAENVPERTLESLVASTHGTPLLLTELVRGLKRDGLVRRNPRGGGWYLAFDEAERVTDLPLIDWLAERELSHLPPDLAAHARLAALLGAEFSEMEIEAVLAQLDRDGLGAHFPMDARVATRKLLGMGILIQHRRGAIGFRHGVVREAVRGSTPESLRVQVHRAASRFYGEAAHLMAEGERLPRLAFHAAKAGLRDQAGALYLQLAEQARSRHAYVQAESLYSQALQLLPAGDDRSRMVAWRGRGLMRYRASRFDAVEDLALAREAARRLGDHAAEIEVMLDESTAFDWTDEYRKSRALVGEAEALARSRLTGDGRAGQIVEARVLLGHGRALWRFCERKQALQKLLQAVERAEVLGDDGYETLVVSLLLLGDLLPWYGETARAEQAFERVIALCEAHGDRVHVAVALLNRRQIWIARRDLANAVEDTRRCIQIASELGLATTVFMGSYNLGEMFYQAGQAEAAWPHVLRAVEIEERRSSGVGRPVARVLQARLLAFEGQQQSARSLVDEIRAHQAGLAASGTTDGLLMPSEDVLLTLVDLFTRDASDDDWRALRSRADTYAVEQELIEVADLEARWLARRGRTAEARRRFEDAHRLAERIPNLLEPRLRAGTEALETGPEGVAAGPPVCCRPDNDAPIGRFAK